MTTNNKTGGYWATERLPEGDGPEPLQIFEGMATTLSGNEVNGLRYAPLSSAQPVSPDKQGATALGQELMATHETDAATVADGSDSNQVDGATVQLIAEELLPLDDNSPSESDTTDKTDVPTVTNEDFLVGIFGSELRQECPIVCAFPGNPEKAPKKSWVGEAWSPGDTDTAKPGCNAYFSLAAFSANDSGQYGRLKKYFAGLFCIMLDDIGTKAAGIERLAGLPPSWLIETSPGNYQAGYILAQPITDPAVAEALYQAVIGADLCDPGAGGPQTRLARMPVAINGKSDPAFSCRLVEWRPDARYTPEQIISGLGLDLDLAQFKGRSGSRKHPDPYEDVVYTPRTTENVVVVALKAAGLYKTPLGSGKHDMTCPWVSEHSDQTDGGTAYFEPSDAFQVGGFKCLHGHCAGRHIGDLLRHLGIALQEAKHKPTIRIANGEIPRIVEAAEYELAQSGRHYQRGGLIVTVQTDPGTQETGIKELNPQNLVLVISSVVIWMKFVPFAGWVVTDPPVRHSRILYDRNSYQHLPVLHGLARQPYLRSDGSLMTQPGYDPATALFGVFDARDFSIPEQPTREDALAALNELQALLGEFSFADDCDFSAALAGIVTATIRASLRLAPMFHIRAPLIASGKSYLCTVIAAFGSPSIPSAISFPTDDEECRKLLLASLLTGPATIIFDNLTEDLKPYKSLCSALTEEYISGRILGVSKTATVGTRTMFMSSGNNVDPVRDMTRRCVPVRLDPACEVPATRMFLSDPLTLVRQNRGKYVSLVLTIIRAWIVAGCPKTNCKTLASYEQWSDWVRQPLLWLGLPDPATAVFETMTSDPDREALGRLLALWFKLRGTRPTMVRDLVKEADKFSKDPDRIELLERLLEIAENRGEVDRRRLGWWIKKHASRIVDGLKLERAPGQRNADQWVIKSVVSVPSDLSPPMAASVAASHVNQDEPSPAPAAMSAGTNAGDDAETCLIRPYHAPEEGAYVGAASTDVTEGQQP